ncbi:lpha beta hydrolase [Diaporthe amygdali]|uniref:lpha beta hydrolase n=1 Tax=Phomopsis amygdali TaxID=1214568 RepID=UPI0022FF2724|nr:lpha beta hydrolase [Diaporthe amygdali]KAJ0117734.1 lpha beta hydrolase [Diaporthe amygdali]
MASTFPERVSRMLGPYRTPVILTSCAALLITPFVWKKFTYTPELLPPIPKDYQYRLHLVAKDGSSSFTLPDGRKIGYAQYGDPNGKPIISLHGILGSRLESALLDANAKELGARIIAIERPGIGWSDPSRTPLKERRVIDHAKDVEALAEHLQVKEYAVLGTSAGGPYALGCAHSLPSSSSKPALRAVAILTGLGLPDMSQAWPPFVVFLNRTFDLRWAMRWIFTRSAAWQMHLSDEERMEGLRREIDLKKTHPADVETTRRADYPDLMRLFLCSAREAVSQGWEGFLEDIAVLSKDPGFRVENIRPDIPIQLWCGTDDTNVSPKAGEETAERLRAGGNTKVELHMEAGHTHGSTQVKFQKTVLKDLLRAMDS